ncbi:MAG: putative cyclase/dehydrase [Frankiales bacterium]|nr:putative cyclase/dehydrase [Frankiales bacterium]
MDLTSVGVEVEHHFDAPVEDVFALLTDVERMAGLGPEHERAQWLDEARTRFRGWNRLGERTWEVVCPVITFEPPTAFAFVVGDDPAHPSSTWSYTLTAEGPGTLVRQRFQHGPGESGLSHAVRHDPDHAQAIIDRRLEQHANNMIVVLRAAEALLTGTPPTA